MQHRQTESHERFGYPGNGTHTVVNLERQGFPSGVGLANLTRASVARGATDTVSVYAGDVLTFDRWTVDAGLRFDRQRGRNLPSQAPANGLAPSILPALDYPGGPYLTWNGVSPRVGTTFRLTDKTIVRGSYARYASQLGSNLVAFENATQLGTIQYRFEDFNRDNLAQASELLAATGVVSGINPADPAAPYAPNVIDPGLDSPIVNVIVTGVEREVRPNFSLGVNVGRSSSALLWSPYTGLSADDFVECRTCTPAGVTSTTPVYRLAQGVSLPPGNSRTLANREGYHRRYWNVDLLATRRLADRWMLRGFVTLQQHQEYFDDPARSIQDPTPRYEQQLVSGFIDGGLATNPTQGGEFLIHSRWNYSLAGLYELARGFSVSGTIYGRQGYPRGEIFTANRPDGLGLTPVLLDRDISATRFPSVHLVDLRLQKRLDLGRARALLMFDVFNVLDGASTLRQVGESTATTFRNPLEIVAPRLVRLGVQLHF
jgi:hypothetical protein